MPTDTGDEQPNSNGDLASIAVTTEASKSDVVSAVVNARLRSFVAE